MTKILIIFDTWTGSTERVSVFIGNIIKELGAELRIKHIENVSKKSSPEANPKSDFPYVKEEDLNWADGIVFGFPIHTGTFTASLKFFIDEYHTYASNGGFLNKPVTVFSVGKLKHAGAETAIQQLQITLMQWACLIVSTGITSPEILDNNGNPYGLYYILNAEHKFDNEELEYKATFAHFKRFVEITTKNTNVKKSIESFNIADRL